MLVGNCRFTVSPLAMLKRENELKALAPRTVAVVMSLTAPWVLMRVSVRPSGTMSGAAWAEGRAGGASPTAPRAASAAVLLSSAQRRSTHRYCRRK